MLYKNIILISACLIICKCNPLSELEHIVDWIDPFESESDEKAEESKFVQDVEKYIVNFMYYSRENPDNYHLLQLGNLNSLDSSMFQPEKETKIIVHGWKNAYNSNYSVTMKDAYLESLDVNVILVDWSVQSHKNYWTSRFDVSKVADVVADMIDELVIELKMESSKCHMVGHSLGAHIAGIAGLRLKTGNISRITGLDPAMPMFTVYESNRLRADSAEFVDVVHTCGNLLGFKSALGQVDFYPNGGTFEQPGCGLDYKGHCSHSRSYLYFAESIKSNKFMAVKCPDWSSFKNQQCSSQTVPMGEYTSRTARGRYYLRTGKRPPFALGDYSDQTSD